MSKIEKCIKLFRLRLIALTSIIVMLVVIDLSWLAGGFLFAFAGYFLLVCFSKIRNSYFITSMVLILTIVTSSVLLKLFVFEIFNVPSQSMENSLYPGEKIMVSKLHYGPLLPNAVSDIPWLNLFFNPGDQIPIGNSIEKEKMKKRLSGFSSIKLNDIVVCKPIGAGKEFLVKRCIGLPGDRVQIDDNIVSINNVKIEEAPTVKLKYWLFITNRVGFVKVADSLNLIHYLNRSEKFGWTILDLSVSELSVLQKNGLVDSLRSFNKDQRAFPNNDEFNWTYSRFGPLTIPYLNFKISINRANYILYERLLRGAEKANITESNGKYYIDGRRISHYTFRNNYYFFLGDNRNNSKDSRDWGLISSQEIEGKAVYKVDLDKREIRKVI